MKLLRHRCVVYLRAFVVKVHPLSQHVIYVIIPGLREARI